MRLAFVFHMNVHACEHMHMNTCTHANIQGRGSGAVDRTRSELVPRAGTVCPKSTRLSRTSGETLPEVQLRDQCDFIWGHQCWQKWREEARNWESLRRQPPQSWEMETEGKAIRLTPAPLANVGPSKASLFGGSL